MSELSNHHLFEGASYPLGTPLDDLLFTDDQPIDDYAFGVTHHRASERGRMAIAAIEYGREAAMDEGGY